MKLEFNADTLECKLMPHKDDERQWLLALIQTIRYGGNLKCEPRGRKPISMVFNNAASKDAFFDDFGQ